MPSFLEGMVVCDCHEEKICLKMGVVVVVGVVVRVEGRQLCRARRIRLCQNSVCVSPNQGKKI